MNKKESPKIKEVLKEELKFDKKQFFQDLFILKKGVNYKGTISEIQDKISMNGGNAWMLFSSIMIASIGLNLNSQAVIIGAMLISPLMSPILGVGLGVGINDQKLLIKALINFCSAMIIAIIASTIYFALSPLGDYTEQIQARTEPTFLDILIAFFGGIAGIVSIVRKDVSTTLPGVAIATALMPPLCVTGYGIAAGSLAIASKAFYLFFLNSFFVAFSTYIIIRYLRFPYNKYITREERRRNMTYVGLFSLAMIIPSLFIFHNVLGKVGKELAVNQLIEQGLGERKIFLDNHEIIHIDGAEKLILKVYGDEINNKDIPKFKEILASTSMKNTDIQIISTSEINLQQIKFLESQINEMGSINKELSAVQKAKREQESLISKLEKQLDNSILDSVALAELTKELKLLFPELKTLDFGNIQSTQFDTTHQSIPSFYFEWANKSSKRNTDREKLDAFIRERLEWDTLKIVHY